MSATVSAGVKPPSTVMKLVGLHHHDDPDVSVEDRHFEVIALLE
ncbi:MAG TPA: hypothetical protein VG346_09930 [Acidimicrobiales bacterium]|nr:hypothetical protein [Acidimicrobiales bacterium]